MALYTYRSQSDLNRMLNAPKYNPNSQTMWNALGRTEGAAQANGGGDNFFTKTGKSLENAFGTTGAALYEAGGISPGAIWSGLTGSDYTSHRSKIANEEQEQRRQDTHKAIDNVYRQFGYDGREGFDRLVEEADARGDQAELNRLLNNTELNNALSAQANTNAENIAAGINAYNDYRNNNYASQKINQDRGKFAGSAINTLNTMADVGLMAAGIPAGVAFNSLQGATGGLADELEQNGGMNSTNIADWFGPNGVNWEQAGKNAIVGATTGAVTGALNKGLNKMVNPQTGNLFKGGNALTRGMNKLGSSTALGRLGSTIATGATRGAISGAVGGATGAGLSTALNGGNFGDVVGNAAQGFAQGAKSGAITGGTMAGINKVANATLNRLAPNTAAAIRKNQQRNASYGEGFFNQLDKAWHSGDSNFRNWIEGARNSKLLGSLGNVGNSVRNVSSRDISRAAKEYSNTTDGRVASAELVDFFNKSKGMNKAQIEAMAYNYSDETDGRIDPNELISFVNEHTDIPQYGVSSIPGLKAQDDGTYGSIDRLTRENLSYSPDEIIEMARLAPNSGTAELAEIYARNNPDLRFDYDDYKSAVADITKIGTTANKQFTNWVKELKAASGTPTTVGGWVKKAGQRFVEDANQRGVGLGIKDVSGEESYDAALNRAVSENLAGPEYNEVLAPYSGLPNKVSGEDLYRLAQSDPDIQSAVSYVASEIADADFTTPTYDSIANDTDYWNEVRALYAKSQNYQGPGEYFDNADTYELSAPTRPTQTSGSAYDRIAQEAGYNNYDEVIKAYMAANPGVQLNQKGAAGQILNWLDSNPNTDMPTSQFASRNDEETTIAQSLVDNPDLAKQQLKNLKAKSLENRAAENLLNQVGTAKAPAAKADNMIENVKAFMEEGLTKPEEWQLASEVVTGANGVMSKLHRNLMESAGDIDTFSGAGGKYGQGIEDTLDYYIQARGLVGNDAQGVRNEVLAVLDSLPSRQEGSITMTDSAADTMSAIRELESHRRNYLGENSKNYSTTTPYKEQKASVIRDITSLLENRIYEKVPDATQVVTADAINQIKSAFPGNEKWANSVDNTFANIKTGKDLRAAQKRFVQTSDYLNNVKQNYGTYGQRVGDVYGNMLSKGLSKVPIVGGIMAELTNTPMMNRAYANINSARADRLRGQAIDLPSSTKLVSTPTTTQTTTPTATLAAATTTSKATNPSNWLYNAIGRQEGLSNAEQANTAQYLANAAQEAEVVPKAPNAGSLEELVSPTTSTASTSVYNSVYGTPTTSYGGLQETGDYWTDLIGRAMMLAGEADDANAFGALFGMYQNALSNLQSASSSSSATKLTDKQRQANAAAVALEDFAQSEPNFAYDVSDIPVVGGIANLGGNDYQSKAEALALQVGYMLSGATVNKDEAKKIGMAYVPQPRDNSTVRQNKLNQLRGIISEYQRTNAE